MSIMVFFLLLMQLRLIYLKREGEVQGYGSLPRPSGAERAGTTYFERTASPRYMVLRRTVKGAKQRDVLRGL